MRGWASASIDGRRVGSIEGQLSGAEEYTEFGQLPLKRGRHRLLIHYDSRDVSPGTATPSQLPYPSGPIVIDSNRDDPGVSFFAPSRARELCLKRWDWVEAVG